MHVFVAYFLCNISPKKLSKLADVHRSNIVPHQCHFLELCGIGTHMRFVIIFYTCKCMSVYDLHIRGDICCFTINCLLV